MPAVSEDAIDACLDITHKVLNLKIGETASFTFKDSTVVIKRIEDVSK